VRECHVRADVALQVKDTPDAPAAAARELEKLGPMSVNEKITAGACDV
jgi:hypothetical protein